MPAISIAAVSACCDSARSPSVLAVSMNNVLPSAPPTAHAIACLAGVSIVRVTSPPSTTWMNRFDTGLAAQTPSAASMPMPSG